MLNLGLFRAVLTLCLVAALGGIQAALAQVFAPTVPQRVAVSSERLERLTATLRQ